DAGRLDFDPDGAVLVEVPEEAVDIVPDGRERRDYEPARTPHHGILALLAELPEDAVVLFVQADGVPDPLGFPMPIMRKGVEIVDVTEAVAAKRQGIEILADAVFPGVEGVLAVVAAGRVAIGHHHLGERGSVHDGADAAAILV